MHGEEARLLMSQVLILVLIFMVCNHSVPQFPHLLSEGHHIIYLAGLL